MGRFCSDVIRVSRRCVLFTFASLIVPFTIFSKTSPQLEKWITTIGGETARAATADSQGRIYIVGDAGVGLQITSNAFAPAPASDRTNGFLLELDSLGSSILYGTYLNGLIPQRIVVDGAGYIYVLGDHHELGLIYPFAPPAPITANAAQSFPATNNTPVLVKIAPSGELVYGTFLGGGYSQAVAGSAGLAVDSHGSAIVCGTTADPNLPTSTNAFQSELRGQGDVYIARVSADGHRFEALTYLGGTGADFCEDIKVDSSGNIFVYGDTNSRRFPVTTGAYETVAKGPENLFVAKFDSELQHLLWSTYIGDSGNNLSQFMTLAPDGSLYLTGTTDAFDFPVSPDTAPPYFEDPPYVFANNFTRPFVARLDASGARLVSAYVFPCEGGFLSPVVGTGPLFVAGWSTISGLSANATLNATGLPALLDLGASYPFPFLLRFDTAMGSPDFPWKVAALA